MLAGPVDGVGLSLSTIAGILVSILEVNTIVYGITALALYVAWWHKPHDVMKLAITLSKRFIRIETCALLHVITHCGGDLRDSRIVQGSELINVQFINLGSDSLGYADLLVYRSGVISPPPPSPTIDVDVLKIQLGLTLIHRESVSSFSVTRADTYRAYQVRH
ncbi:uncharacterized protein H6S33_009888 [Morchella sextelata]|uniref:uncharacterized protein n=1 Tax=Morchella sextelata TaxID=1174677 RepID=UPI001D047E08|nr:uncharacterized protein H6S33_009888 [Morchella sextelata]KAH0602247.1 hypothetical protein H6S33_009888 [Morchella sextelata]